MIDMLLNFIRIYLWRPYLRVICKLKDDNVFKKEMAQFKLIEKNSSNGRIFYLGICAHSNLGDMAQYYCICKWIKENYPTYDLYQFESRTVLSDKTKFIEKITSIYTSKDIIIFQSGYTTQDLGGVHEQMHREIIDALPNARILMMPQTIFFQNEANRQRCSMNHSKAKNMLFLARDFNSYDQAKFMFKGVRVEAFPDIVTTLIGTMHFNNERNGVCLCRRNDSEKYYSEDDLMSLVNRIRQHDSVIICDTTIKEGYKKIRRNLQQFIETEISNFSHYKVTITDRYHGTIFSLVAGTPVIIIKTIDYKVTTGADWFKGIYDDYVFVANNLDEAYALYKIVVSKKLNNSLSSYMKQHYYDKLKDLFETL